MHQHHSILSILKTPYSKIYTPLSLWAFEKLAGKNRRDAALWGSRSRWARFWINLVSLTVIILAAAFIGFAEFWNHGAELPLWASAITVLGMGLNMLAILVGAGANHRTIDQYYDAQVAWAHYRGKNDLGDTPDKKWMLSFRYGHDLNGLAGSCLSTLVFFLIAYVFFQDYDWDEIDFTMHEAETELPLFSTQDLSIIFVASRASSVLSMACAPLTNQARISYYEKNLESSAQKYQNDAQYNSRIIPLLNSIESLKQDTIESRAMRARAFRALESCLANSSGFPPAAPNLLEQIISQYKEGDSISQQKMIQRWDVSFLDSLPFIECEFAIALMMKLKDQSYRLDEIQYFLKCQLLSNNPEVRLLAQRFRLYALQNSGKDIQTLWNEKCAEYIPKDGSGNLAKSAIARSFPDTIHPHAAERDFNPEYHVHRVFTA